MVVVNFGRGENLSACVGFSDEDALVHLNLWACADVARLTDVQWGGGILDA